MLHGLILLIASIIVFAGICYVVYVYDKDQVKNHGEIMCGSQDEDGWEEFMENAILKLGKLAPKAHAKTLDFARYALKTQLPIPPSKTAWEYKIADWKVFKNDQYGDCTCAGPAHEIMNRTVNSGSLVTPTDSEVLAMYSAISGFDLVTGANDNGAAITDALNYLQTVGLSGHKISGWAKIVQANISSVKLAIYLFGSINVGVQLPNSAMRQFELGEPWDVEKNDGGIDGGHCIPIMGYGADGCTCITWGKRQQMSWEWFLTYCDEAYAEIAPDWFDGKGYAANHLNVAALQADLKAIAA